MPYEVDLPKRLKTAGWKVKIREKERLEPPHVTVLCGKKLWRIGLRDEEFLVPPGGKWRDIDEDVREIIEEKWKQLQEAWDRMYPSNPIVGREEDEDEDD